MIGWNVQQLWPRPAVPTAAQFSPVARVSALRQGVKKEGTGFVVHPRVLVTAAHVVTFPQQGRAQGPQRVRVELGAWDCWAEKVALPDQWVARMLPLFDFAVLRLERDVCGPELTCVFEVMSGVASSAAELLGFGGAPAPIQARQSASELAYPLGDRPTWSGAPIVNGREENGRLKVIGLHTSHTAADGMGRGLALAAEEIRRAMVALGLSFEVKEEETK